MEKLDRTNWIVIGMGVAILLVGGWWVMTQNQAKSEAVGGNGEQVSTSTGSTATDTSDTTDIAPSSSVTEDGEAVAVPDQPAGSFVSVGPVTLSKMGWVAIKDEKGWILGAGRLDAGMTENIQVPLLRNTESGSRYQVLLYIDDGDKVFDFHKDMLVMNADGGVVGVMFTALNGD